MPYRTASLMTQKADHSTSTATTTKAMTEPQPSPEFMTSWYERPAWRTKSGTSAHALVVTSARTESWQKRTPCPT